MQVLQRRWTEPELRELCTMVGLQAFERIRTRQYIMISAKKPGQPQQQGADQEEDAAAAARG